MKIELEFEFTKVGDDSVEGTWRRTGEDEQNMMAEYILRCIASSAAILSVWGIDSPETLYHLIEFFDVSLYDEDGREGECLTSGVFTAWKHGIPT